MIPSRHFTRGELIRSETAFNLSINNEPNISQWFALDLIVNVCAEPIREEWGRLKVSSGFRCYLLNLEIDGESGSQHLRGEALDLIPLDADRDEVFEWIRNSDLQFDQLIIYDSKPHFHISYTIRRSNRRQVLRCDKHGNYYAI